MILNVFTDGGGGLSSTYGDCAAAYVVETSESLYLGSRSVCLVGTNNDAEYMGVLSALRDMKAGEWAPLPEIEKVYFMSDSMLIVNQINGEWRCKDQGLRVHLEEIRAILATLPFPISFGWHKRIFNTDADLLCAAATAGSPKTVFTDPIPRDPRKKKGKSHARSKPIIDLARALEHREQGLSGPVAVELL
jgi:ribonuclease HI